MKKHKTVDYIPVKEDKVLFSVRIEEKLKYDVENELKALGRSWVDLVEGMFRKFLDEQKGK